MCVRAYAYLGETGEAQINFGENTPQEDELGFNFVDDANELDEDDWARLRRRYRASKRLWL